MVESILENEVDTNKSGLWRWLPYVLTIVLAAASATGGAIYSNAKNETRLGTVEQRTDKLENNTVNKDQFNDVKDDVREIKRDIKDILKNQKR